MPLTHVPRGLHESNGNPADVLIFNIQYVVNVYHPQRPCVLLTEIPTYRLCAVPCGVGGVSPPILFILRHTRPFHKKCRGPSWLPAFC